MSKVAERYLDVDPWAVVEQGLHRRQTRVSESIFSLANEFMGVRGFSEFGGSLDSLQGCYFNGVYETEPVSHPAAFRGFVTETHFMANAVNWLYCRVSADGEVLDPGASTISGFERRLDMRRGVLTTRFVWTTRKGRRLKVRTTRLVSMVRPGVGATRLEIESIDFKGAVTVRSGLDFDVFQESGAYSLTRDRKRETFWRVLRVRPTPAGGAIMAKTRGSGIRLFSAYRLEADAGAFTDDSRGAYTGKVLKRRLAPGRALRVDKLAGHHVGREAGETDAAVWAQGRKGAAQATDVRFDALVAEQAAYWERQWGRTDIEIRGDPAVQQGIRFCIFQLHQTYHGVDPRNGIGAKGLTGEVYGGHSFWDNETYCLPFYLFNNPAAARSLLSFRYHTLPQAVERAKQKDCRGARFPMCTINGSEACGVWQHGDLEIHVPGAVAYGVMHYHRVTGDREFLYAQGAELVFQVSRYYASRGAWSPTTGEFGLWGVMGPDEFHMMVHNNAYTNTLAKKVMEFALDVAAEMRRRAPARWAALRRKIGLTEAEVRDWRRMAAKMRILADPRSGLIEQHDGYYDLPHTDVKAIPPEQFPLYKHWAYYRIFRTDMIKQPDVLLLMLFFSADYPRRAKRANYDFYEPRCSHESSLSPGVHSILACELGRLDEAYAYVRHAFRLDLDNFNRNTHEGLHTTSMAAAWLNVVYGFGGMRSDGDLLSFAPTLPKPWTSYAFRVLYAGSTIAVEVDRKRVRLRVVEGGAVTVRIYGKIKRVGADGLICRLGEKSS